MFLADSLLEYAHLRAFCRRISWFLGLLIFGFSSVSILIWCGRGLFCSARSAISCVRSGILTLAFLCFVCAPVRAFYLQFLVLYSAWPQCVWKIADVCSFYLDFVLDIVFCLCDTGFTRRFSGTHPPFH